MQLNTSNTETPIYTAISMIYTMYKEKMIAQARNGLECLSRLAIHSDNTLSSTIMIKHVEHA